MDSWDNPAYEAMQAYQKTAALTAAMRLDIVTLIGDGVATSDALAEKIAASKPRDSNSVRLSHRDGSADEAGWSL